MHRSLRPAPNDKHSVVISARCHSDHLGLARRQSHCRRLAPELVPPWLQIFVEILGSVFVRAKNKMLSARRPNSGISAGILRPTLGKRKEMWITAVHVQLPDPHKIVLQGASRHRYTNFFGVRRKNGIPRPHMAGVPDFLYIFSVAPPHK